MVCVRRTKMLMEFSYKIEARPCKVKSLKRFAVSTSSTLFVSSFFKEHTGLTDPWPQKCNLCHVPARRSGLQPKTVPVKIKMRQGSAALEYCTQLGDTPCRHALSVTARKNISALWTFVTMRTMSAVSLSIQRL